MCQAWHVTVKKARGASGLGALLGIDLLEQAPQDMLFSSKGRQDLASLSPAHPHDHIQLDLRKLGT